MCPEQELWQTVIELGFVDALRPGPANAVDIRAKSEAIHWISRCTRDFREVCALAGMDPKFLSDAFNAGRVSSKDLKNTSKVGRRTE